MTSPAAFRLVAEQTCVDLSAATGAGVGLLRLFGHAWAPLVGATLRAPLAPEVLHPGVPVRLGPDWALASVGDRDGAVFGAIVVRGEPVDGLAGLLVSATAALEEELHLVRSEEHEERLRDREPADAETDLESGTGTPGYWRRCLLAEEGRSRLLEHPATVLLTAPVARTGAGWLGPCVSALRKSSRSVDVLARPEPDLVALLAVECPEAASGALAERLRASLLEAGVAVGCGAASRAVGGGLAELVEVARKRMRSDLAGRDVLKL
jgi:hypothetical protein